MYEDKARYGIMFEARIFEKDSSAPSRLQHTRNLLELEKFKERKFYRLLNQLIYNDKVVHEDKNLG